MSRIERRTAKRMVGIVRLARVKGDVRAACDGLESARVSDPNAASFLHSTACQLEAQAAHLRALSIELTTEKNHA